MRGSLPTRGAWIEILSMDGLLEDDMMSLPTRGAWIEIKLLQISSHFIAVAPHTGSVD